MSREVKKRIEIVRLKMCREDSILYSPRKVSSPEDAVGLVRSIIGESDREMFLVITLDTKNQFNAVDICSIGSVNASIVHPREVFKLAIISNASGILIAHNHPSGITKPSKEDERITERIKEAANIIGIPIVDHLIVGVDSYYSFKENGNLI